ncbi:MAG: chemotaxis protein CheW [Symploca sp. SIO2G7]|nr:chemotaxis protein CheW [Symploca sp. SIO2G7]
MQSSSIQNSPSLKPTSRLQQLLPELFNPKPVSGEQFLRLQLTSELTIAIALSWVEETLLVDTQWVTPMPNMPPYTLGLMSSKSRVFWATDLIQLLKLPVEFTTSQNYEVVVIRALANDGQPLQDEPLFLGLVVPKIRGAVRLTREEIVSPLNEVDENLQPYLSGQVFVDGETVLILSAEAIGSAQPAATSG